MTSLLTLARLLERITTGIAAVVVARAAWRVAHHPVPANGRSDKRPPEGMSTPRAKPDDAAAALSRDEPHIHIDSSDESTASATGACVAHVLARPDSIRHRAQNAATISSAVAAALVVAAVVQLARQDDESWRWWTIALVALAVLSWVVAVWLFVCVVTHGRADPPEDKSYQALINAYENHSIRLRRRLRRAAAASGVALVVTAVAVVVEVGERTYTRETERQVMLTAEAASAVAAICGWETASRQPDQRVRARLSSDELSKRVVRVEVVSRPLRSSVSQRFENCMAPNAEMRLPRDAIIIVNDLGG